jgi:hypothetical protein
MEATFSQKSDAKKQHSPTPEPLAEAQFSSEMEQGATAGVPLFLQRLPVQPKLVVGQPNDPLEQEADRVAERVQSGSHQSAQTTSTEADSVQRKCAKCEEKVQAKSLGTIAASSSSLPLPDAGSALSKEVRSRVEPILGADLSHVRVHNSPSAQATAKDLNAKAFTHKNHIWLGANQSPNDIALLSHEATHVVQQTGHENESPLVQRVVVDPAVEDGAEVQRRLRQRIDEALGTRSPTPAPAPNNTPNAATPANAPATVDPETRRAAQQVDRSELAAKTTEVQPDARPSVDRAAEQQPQVEAAAKTTEESLDKPPEEKAEGEGKEAGQGEKKGGAEKAAVAAANQAASIADQAFSMADSQSLPDQPAQVVPPTPIAPVDAGGMPLPDHPEMDEQLFALANQAQELREQGQNQRAHATEGTANTRILRGNLQLVQQSIGQSESGVKKAQGHLEFRRGLLNQAQQALTISEQKAANLTQQAPEGVSQAASGQEKSGSLASESRDLAGQNNANTPDDPEAAQKSQEQGSKLNQVGSDAASIDDTLTQVHTASNTLVQDAAHATQVNTQTRGRVAGMEATLQQTDASLSAMQEQNSQARSQLDAVQEQPALLKAEATGMDAEGQDMIATSLDIEARIHQAQQNHAAGMQTVPAVEQPQEEMQAIPAEEASEPQAIETPPVAEQSVATVLEPPASAAMQVPETELMPAESAPSQEAAIQKPETSPVTEPASAAMQVPETELMSAESAPGEEVIIQRQVAATTPQAEATPPQPANINIARGLPSWVTGEPEPNAAERQAAQEREEARRQQEIDEINAIANERGGFDRLTAAERRRIAFRLAMRNTFGGISNISWPGLGGIARGAGHLAAGLIDPRAPLMGVVSGVNMIINGVVNFGRQPSWIGALRLAANVATGLTIILGSITALAGVIAALMTAFTIVTLGTAAPFTGPIIAFCATIMSTVGGWTFWVGLIAAALQALTFVADLWQAGTAQTADQLQQQSETMTEDARNAGNALLQAGMGRLAQVGGRQMQSAISQAGGGVRFAAQMGARSPVASVVSGVRRAGAIGYGKELTRGASRQIVSSVKALPGRIAGGARSLGTAAKALPGRIVSGARSLGTAAKALPGRIVSGARSLGTAAKALPGRIVSGARSLGTATRALPGRMVIGVKSLASSIAQAPGQFVRWMRSAPSQLRQYFSRSWGIVREELEAAGVVGNSRKSLDDFLRKVWSDRERIVGSQNPADEVYGHYSQATEANPLLTRSTQGYLDEIANIAEGRTPTATSNIQNRTPPGAGNQISDAVQPGSPLRGRVERSFFRFEREGADLNELVSRGAIRERIYINASADHATEVMHFVVRDIIDNPSEFPGIFMSKLTGPGGVARRADAIVIYAEDRAAVERVLQRTQGYHSKNPTHFQTSTPPMTNQVLDGVSLASEPLNSGGMVSFGQLRSEAISASVLTSGTQEEFIEQTLRNLRAAGVNPNAPHLNLSGGNQQALAAWWGALVMNSLYFNLRNSSQSVSGNKP